MSPNPSPAVVLPPRKPTTAFVAAGWVAAIVAMGIFIVALWRMPLGYDQIWFLATDLAFGLFGVVAVVKSVRDREMNIPVTPQFYFLSWVAAVGPIAAVIIYLLNAPQDELQRGFLFMGYMFAVFAAVVVQKNVRDLAEYSEWAATQPKPDKPLGPPPGPAVVAQPPMAPPPAR